ncbi:MAG: nucleoside-diphosphate sugar epimerase/dehydratase [Pyramidobacter sp.]|nr:nucleoside-diphosphate sugar epimerase/dehydratase [Pyramidobacter sp.]
MWSGMVRFWRKLGAHNLCVGLIDVFLLFCAVYVSYALRFSIFLTNTRYFGFQNTALLYIACVMLAFALGGVYRVYWLQVSFEEIVRLCCAYAAGCAGIFGIYVFADHSVIVPRSVMALLAFCGLVFVLAVRILWRLSGISAPSSKNRNALVIGAGEAGSTLVRDLKRRGSALRVVGFLDDDPLKQSKRIAGVPVLGSTESLSEVVQRCGVSDVLVAIPSASRAHMSAILARAVIPGVSVRILPTLQELADGSAVLGSLRPVNLEDLLARDSVDLDSHRIGRLVESKTVLVTGAGGSIGSEIVRQLLPYNPAKIICVGHGEFSIYTLMEELAEKKTAVHCVPVIADVADERAMKEVFDRWRPSVVFHAAAHKHVPLMETNAREAVRVNCLGTLTVGRLAGEFGAERMVLISTDKAVNPSSVMGASKRMAEMTLMNVQKCCPGTSYMAVRFGNVLGSRGSVIPKFEKQIATGGPVTVTHPDMVRYFMLIPEAAGLVLQAAAIGEPGKIYVLDMGKPVKIASLAETLIRLHGLQPGVDIKIECTGIRPGEKLFEELFYDMAHVDPTEHPKIFCARILDGGEHECNMPARIARVLSSPNPVQEIADTVLEYQPRVS